MPYIYTVFTTFIYVFRITHATLLRFTMSINSIRSIARHFSFYNRFANASRRQPFISGNPQHVCTTDMLEWMYALNLIKFIQKYSSSHTRIRVSRITAITFHLLAYSNGIPNLLGCVFFMWLLIYSNHISHLSALRAKKKFGFYSEFT